MNTQPKLRKTAASRTEQPIAKTSTGKAAGRQKKALPQAGKPRTSTTEVLPRKSAPAVQRKALPIAAPAPSATASDTKQSRLIAALQDREGATVKDLAALTGWQPHTVRGTISGVLRKKLGYRIIASATHDAKERRYRIVEAAGQ